MVDERATLRLVVRRGRFSSAHCKSGPPLTADLFGRLFFDERCNLRYHYHHKYFGLVELSLDADDLATGQAAGDVIATDPQ
jgi:hypothetical protein